MFILQHLRFKLVLLQQNRSNTTHQSIMFHINNNNDHNTNILYNTILLLGRGMLSGFGKHLTVK